MLTFDTSDLASRYSKRLAIIVPYRNRAEHLARFLPHMAAYFQREKLDKLIDMSIHIVEQNGTDPFNRGRLANCGFMLTRDNNDYIVVHDVDYLPIWSDYSWSAMPLRLIWHGLSRREDWSNFFGAIVLFIAVALTENAWLNNLMILVQVALYWLFLKWFIASLASNGQPLGLGFSGSV